MKQLNYKIPPTKMGGNVFSNAGVIHFSEIDKTIDDLGNLFGFSLKNYVVGSAGKREYSGDIDIVLEHSFREILESKIDKEKIKRIGKQSHILFPISNFDISKNKVGPRTGHIQIDFKMGEPEWFKFYNYTDENSEYKSAHRNLAISAICSVKDNIRSLATDPSGRPIEEVRYKFSENGFSRVLRKCVLNSSGKYNKQTQDTQIGDVTFDQDIIAKTLFTDGKIKDLNSLESLLDAINRNFDEEDQDLIYKKIALNFSGWPEHKSYNYPSIIEPFLTSN